MMKESATVPCGDTNGGGSDGRERRGRGKRRRKGSRVGVGVVAGW
jgi:hypothetical protein